MRTLGTLIGLILVGVLISSLDSLLIFVLSGSIPGTAIALTPRATFVMLIIIGMSALGFYTRYQVLHLAQKVSQQFVNKKERSKPSTASQPTLPRRRYQEL